MNRAELHDYIRTRVLRDLEPKKYGGRRSAAALAGNQQDPRKPTGYALGVDDVQPVLDDMVTAGAIVFDRGAYQLPTRAST